MAVGFGNVDNFQETIQATIDNAIDFARSQLYKNETLDNCLECDTLIPEARKKILPGVTHCVMCQEKLDKKISSYYNRRGSKDSQLR